MPIKIADLSHIFNRFPWFPNDSLMIFFYFPMPFPWFSHGLSMFFPWFSHTFHMMFTYVFSIHMAMDQYLLIPFLGGWTSIYQLFWCSPGVPGFWHTAISSHVFPGNYGIPWWSRQALERSDHSWSATKGEGWHLIFGCRGWGGITLWLCQNSYWKWPLIVHFPMKNCDFQ